VVGGRGGGVSGFLGMWGGGWLFFRRERIPPMQARVTSVSPFQRERRDRRTRLGRRTRTVAGRRFTLEGKDDLGEREEEAEYCFKDFHKLEGFFNF